MVVFFSASVFHKMYPVLPCPESLLILKVSCWDFDGSLQNDLTDSGWKGFVLGCFVFCLVLVGWFAMGVVCLFGVFHGEWWFGF